MPNSSPSDAIRSNPCSGNARTLHPTLYLDYGADSVGGEDAACELCARGMRFRSRWRFEIGALLKIAFTLAPDTCSCAERLDAEAMVVDCTPDSNDPDGPLLTTLAFVDPPESLKSALGEVSARLILSGK